MMLDTTTLMPSINFLSTSALSLHLFVHSLSLGYLLIELVINFGRHYFSPDMLILKSVHFIVEVLNVFVYFDVKRSIKLSEPLVELKEGDLFASEFLNRKSCIVSELLKDLWSVLRVESFKDFEVILCAQLSFNRESPFLHFSQKIRWAQVFGLKLYNPDHDLKVIHH
jgi:hypothetical protein